MLARTLPTDRSADIGTRYRTPIRETHYNAGGVTALEAPSPAKARARPLAMVS